MEVNNIELNQIDFGKLESNSLYAIKFPDTRYDPLNTWKPPVVSSIIKKLNETGKEYGIEFIPLFYGMEVVNDEKLIDNESKE